MVNCRNNTIPLDHYTGNPPVEWRLVLDVSSLGTFRNFHWVWFIKYLLWNPLLSFILQLNKRFPTTNCFVHKSYVPSTSCHILLTLRDCLRIIWVVNNRANDSMLVAIFINLLINVKRNYSCSIILDVSIWELHKVNNQV